MPNVSQTPDKTDEMFRGLLDAHNKAIAMFALRNRSVIDPGSFLDEFSSGAGSVSWQLQIDRPALIEQIIFAFTPVGAATLTIGPQSGTTRTIPIPSSTTNNPGFLDCAMVVRPGDIVTLNAGSATAVFLEIMGKCLTGTEWSVV